MRPTQPSAAVPPDPATGAEEPPGIPGLRSWRRVYAAVILGFLAGLALLSLLPRLAS